MGERVARTARRAGTGAAGLRLLERAHALAMEPRLLRLTDDHGADFLHPGRTALVLLLDTGEARAEVLAAAMFVETERADLRVEPGRIAAGLEGESGREVAALVAEVPGPLAPDLAERLVVAEESVQRIALAERLDQLRHAHLWPEPERRREAHARALEVYGPVAERGHPRLAARYRWWCDTFARNHLG